MMYMGRKCFSLLKILESKNYFNFLLNWFPDTASLNCWDSVFQNIGPV